jgi:hypothetical protein
MDLDVKLVLVGQNGVQGCKMCIAWWDLASASGGVLWYIRLYILTDSWLVEIRDTIEDAWDGPREDAWKFIGKGCFIREHLAQKAFTAMSMHLIV